MEKQRFYTSESVAPGHPDKVCDQVSDAILDELLRHDPRARVACESFVTMGLLIIGGEITTSCYVDIQNVARRVIKDIGYTDPKYGFSYQSCAVINTVHRQAPDIAQGVDAGGAGDQGIMVGYACDETPELMPLPIILAHKLVKRMAEVRQQNILKYLGPDGKAQVTVEYQDGIPRAIDSVVLACQHTEEILEPRGQKITEKARQELIDVIAHPVLKGYSFKDTKFYINQTGKFTIGGPQSDTGMTGRKIVVDTYGGRVPVGGGAFSGKDPTKVDRSAAYMARYIAKNIVAAGLARKCAVELAYVIGKAEPLSVEVDTFGTSKVPEQVLKRKIIDIFYFTPRGMIEQLDLLKPIYLKTACYGHFGRNEEGFTWEKTDKVKDLKRI